MIDYEEYIIGHITDGKLEIVSKTPDRFGNKDFLIESFAKSEILKIYDNLIEIPLTFGCEVRVDKNDTVWAVFYLMEKGKSFLDSFANIEIIIDEEELTIKWVGVKDDDRLRRKGIAKFLIYTALNYSKIIFPLVTKARLDDDSDYSASGTMEPEERELNLSLNLYHKLGFRYENEDEDPPWEPEMEGDIDTILSGEASFIQSKVKRQIDG